MGHKISTVGLEVDQAKVSIIPIATVIDQNMCLTKSSTRYQRLTKVPGNGAKKLLLTKFHQGFYQEFSTATKDYLVQGNDAKNLLLTKYKICCLPCMRRINLKRGFGLDHYKCTSHTNNKSGFKYRYPSHKD